MPKPGIYKWHKIAESIAELPFESNGLLSFNVNGKNICLAIYQNKISACAAKCPHAGGAMSAGFVDGLGNIVCPLHRYKFSLQNGRNTSGEGYFIKTWPVEERDDGIWVGFPY